MVYTFTYTDCASNSHVWTYTYTIDIPDFTLPADGSSTVNCAADAVAPTPPVMQDACGNDIIPVPGTTPSHSRVKAIWYTPLPIPIVRLTVMYGRIPIPSIFQTSPCRLMDQAPSIVQ